jgi:cytochrome c oxidase assembly protein subunit 15
VALEDRWRHRYATLVVISTVLLLTAGGLVTSTGSGLAVPDWPLSFGQVFPRMEGGVLYEHGHRMVATAVGLLTVFLTLWTARAEPRRWVRWLGWVMLGSVIVQGVLGGVTVLLRLPHAVSVAHAGLAQIFLGLTVVMATVTSPRFLAAAPAAGGEGPAAGTRMLVMATALTAYLQIVLGAVVRHTGAGLAILTFPLADGRLIPEFTSHLVGWQFAHRVGAVVVTVLVLWTMGRVLRRHGTQPYLVRPAVALVALLALQVLLGALTIWKFRAVTPTTAHVVTGALLFATTVFLAVWSWRLLPAQAERMAPAA